MHKHDGDYDIGKHGATVGIITNAILFFFKIFAGIWGRSHAMVADALHTATDTLTSVGVFIGFKIAQKPADEEHPYGHGRAESITAKIVSLVLIFGGFKVAFDSIKVIVTLDLRTPHQIALWAAISSIIVKEILFRYAHRLGNKIQSASLKADAWHHRTDALSSVAAIIGIAGARMGYPMLDSLAGFAVSLFVIKAGMDIFHSAYDELMDAALPRNMLDKIRACAVSVDGVKKIKDIKGRKMGIDIFVDMIIEVDKSISVEEAHIMTMKVRRNVLKNLRGAKDIFIHVEPYKK